MKTFYLIVVSKNLFLMDPMNPYSHLVSKLEILLTKLLYHPLCMRFLSV